MVRQGIPENEVGAPKDEENFKEATENINSSKYTHIQTNTEDTCSDDIFTEKISANGLHPLGFSLYLKGLCDQEGPGIFTCLA